MHDLFRNPFEAADSARHAIWTMLVERDIDAVFHADWNRAADDFLVEGLLGMDAARKANSCAWRLSFPPLAAHRDEWLHQAHASRAERYAEDPRITVSATTTLQKIDIDGEAALSCKTFDGSLRTAGGRDITKWQTLYRCRLHQGRSKIGGFTGYLPNSLGH